MHVREGWETKTNVNNDMDFRLLVCLNLYATVFATDSYNNEKAINI